MKRIQFALVSGVLSSLATFAIIIIVTYVKCLVSNIDYKWMMALTVAGKGSALAGVILGVLEYMAGCVPPSPQDDDSK